MFGISWAEFFVVIVVAVLVIPSRLWPDVARFLARLINVVRQIIWKITDASENIKQQIDLEKPIDDLVRSTTDDMLNEFSSVLSVKKKNKKTTAKKKASK
jgi:Sec-independent protein translocase protein TatA